MYKKIKKTGKKFPPCRDVVGLLCLVDLCFACRLSLACGCLACCSRLVCRHARRFSRRCRGFSRRCRRYRLRNLCRLAVATCRLVLWNVLPRVKPVVGGYLLQHGIQRRNEFRSLLFRDVLNETASTGGDADGAGLPCIRASLRTLHRGTLGRLCGFRFASRADVLPARGDEFLTTSTAIDFLFHFESLLFFPALSAGTHRAFCLCPCSTFKFIIALDRENVNSFFAISQKIFFCFFLYIMIHSVFFYIYRRKRYCECLYIFIYNMTYYRHYISCKTLCIIILLSLLLYLYITQKHMLLSLYCYFIIYIAYSDNCIIITL